ncbi:glycosyltransferase 87 family protein [Algoriphagus sp. SE2]|uniref:glycosyltransferase 87 family protein n=1 Tax=Algoriphagus sp. SE2 TaxID=3141536 RepID=UPI0031CD36A5
MLIFYKAVSIANGKFWWWFLGGLALRLILLFSMPNWSEDYARFLWDGEMIRLEQNPYLEHPKEWNASHLEMETTYLKGLLNSMNSPEYYSVYPPSNQAVFWLGSLGASQNLKPGIITLRILLLFGELAVFWLLLSLLKQNQKNIKLVILYWFNPLVIMEITGNLHFEGLVLMALLFSLWFFSQEKLGVSGGFWSLAIGLKILPLMLFPSFLANEKIRKSVNFWVVAGLVFFLAFVPLLYQSSWRNLFESLRLYQGKFEFNASIYYLFREVGFWIQGYNTIASLTKLLSTMTFFGILFIVWKKKPKSAFQMAEVWTMSYLIYLILQPVIHPWYIIPAFGLSLLTKINSLTVWTFTAIFSYQAYSNLENYEKPSLLFLEYGVIAFAIFWDYKVGNFNFKSGKTQSYES